MPDPTLISSPVPVIAPEYVVLLLFPPRVNIPDPRDILPPDEPPPDRDPIVSLKLFKLNTAPDTLPIDTPEFAEKAPLAPARSVPPVTEVRPEYEFPVPASTNVPDPRFVTPPVPVMAPE